jgi:adenylylsulfate kinase
MAWVVWFTGLPGCGKTTIAERTRDLLEADGVHVKILQLDEIRRFITPQPKYTDEERDIVYGALAYMARLLYESGVNVIIDATANRRRYRDQARSAIPSFAEVYVVASLDICRQREAVRKARFSPTGIYRKADAGANVPGAGAAYEEPISPEIVVDSGSNSVEQSAKAAFKGIRRIFYDEKIS